MPVYTPKTKKATISGRPRVSLCVILDLDEGSWEIGVCIIPNKPLARFYALGTQAGLFG